MSLSGSELIAEERGRQILDEGFTTAHDDKHTRYQLTDAARCYAQAATEDDHDPVPPIEWPWADGMWKPAERIDDLVKAGALIAAEIDRLLRAGYTHGR